MNTAKGSIRDDRMIAVSRVSMRQTVIIQAAAHLFTTVVYSYSISTLQDYYKPWRTECAWQGHRLAAKAAHEGAVQLNTRDKSWCCYVCPGNGDQSMSWSWQGKAHQMFDMIFFKIFVLILFRENKICCFYDQGFSLMERAYSYNLVQRCCA